ncbi:MAG: PilZ domain-containing protein [Myxococcales bacterium]
MDSVVPGAPRHEVVLAAELETPTRSRLAVTRELSADGARLLSMGRFQPGEAVTLSMLVARSQSKVRAPGKVVFAEPFYVSGPWRCQLVVQFDQPLDAASETMLVSSVVEGEPQ